MNPHIQIILLDEVPEFLGILLEFGSRGDVIEQGGSKEFCVLGRETSDMHVLANQFQEGGERG